ncbi:hypothetical protein LMG28727_07349 [Paraburkholderia kirstenboschensis]|uniref:Mu transposase domain-containing protein n=1 Tax=Paraburkholderia kirstenboschensis TaxID=1245436 RepID=UPI000AEDBF92|nr:hypothetical protein LMG28727_07349 [Paraburkholderia kirstenboschensis]
MHTDGHVVYRKALYSVPFTLVGESLWLRSTDTVVQLFHQHELIATHPRLRKAGERHTVRDHQPPAAQAWLEHDRQWCLARAKEIGLSCPALVVAMFNDTVLVNLRGAQGIVLCARSSAISDWTPRASVRLHSRARSESRARMHEPFALIPGGHLDSSGCGHFKLHAPTISPQPDMATETSRDVGANSSASALLFAYDL